MFGILGERGRVVSALIFGGCGWGFVEGLGDIGIVWVGGGATSCV